MTDMSKNHTTREILAELRGQYPESPFLALGQTVFWDEPMKAVLRSLLDKFELGGQMMLGVHDTDYFAKTHIRKEGIGRFALLAHNDGTTKDLWSAAGEISTLFGSETFPSRAGFVQHGVAFEKIANNDSRGRIAFLNEMTEAWGWRGLVYTGSRDLIVNSLSLTEVGDGVLEMLAWGFENAVQQIAPACCRTEASRIGDTILSWCRDYYTKHPKNNLSDLYQHVYPRMYELLLIQKPEQIHVTSTTSLLQFTPQTASLPRFKFVNAFLDPSSREFAVSAYNKVVEGSTIYALDKFGAGAIPFDIIHPEKGRGTLRVLPKVVIIETKQPITIGLKKPVESIQELAEVLNSKLGDSITLVGKAITLVSMLAQEFIFVFNEEGSLYVSRTRKMNDLLATKGVSLDMRPILRMRYQTWDSLRVGRSSLNLPPHLSAAFARKTMTTPEFAAQWKEAILTQKNTLSTLSNLHKPRELLEYLSENMIEEGWITAQKSLDNAVLKLMELRTQSIQIQSSVRSLYSSLKILKERSATLYKERGDHFRSVSEWTEKELAVRKSYEHELSGLEQNKHGIKQEIFSLKNQRLTLERGNQAIEARSTIKNIEIAAELARLELIRNLLLTCDGLEHTNHRPSAWWIPMLDPSGQWFEEIVQTTELYTEKLISL